MKTKMNNIEIYYSPLTKRWYALDAYGFSIKSSKYPSSIRTFRHLYRAYLTVDTSEEVERIMTKVRKLK